MALPNVPRELQHDKATESYWSQTWAGKHSTYRGIDGIQDGARKCLAPFFTRHLTGGANSVVEAGCGNSKWLPYLASLGYEVSGLDYSETGCDSSRRLLAEAGVTGDIHLGDIFAPPASMLDAYDAVTSLGVIEHFADTAGVVRAIAGLARPGGGLVLTTLPNLSGVIGAAQKRLSRRVYDVHVPLTMEQVRVAHEAAGLDVIECSYAWPLDFHLNHADGKLAKVAHRALMRLTRSLRATEKIIGPIPATRSTATYIVCAARRR